MATKGFLPKRLVVGGAAAVVGVLNSVFHALFRPSIAEPIAPERAVHAETLNAPPAGPPQRPSVAIATDSAPSAGPTGVHDVLESGGDATAGNDRPEDPERRRLLTLVSVGLGGLAATIVAVPVVGALIAPLTRKQPGEWRPVGKVSDFKVGDTVAVTFTDSSPLAWAGVAAQTAAWLRRSSEQDFQAFAINCTHLGCPVRWLQSADLFMCPCHGGVFYKDGTPAAGPPQKPLSVYPVRMQNGEVQIQTSAVPIV